MSDRKKAIKEVLTGDEDVDNEMIQLEVLMDAEKVSNESYDLTKTARLDIKEIKDEIESERSRTDTPADASGNDTTG